MAPFFSFDWKRKVGLHTIAPWREARQSWQMEKANTARIYSLRGKHTTKPQTSMGRPKIQRTALAAVRDDRLHTYLYTSLTILAIPSRASWYNNGYYCTLVVY